MENIRHTPIHQSLHRQNLVMGAERELVMGSALIALLVGVGGMTVLSGVTALVFWLAAIFILRRMARADPQMTKVWMRHIRQQDYYHSRGGRWIKAGGFKARR